MKLSKSCITRIGRAVIAAFAAQVVAAAMCVMPANAMASGMAMHDDACIMHHATQSHAKHACPHCDQPDSIASAHISFDHLPVLVPIAVAVPQWPVAAVAGPVFAVRTPTTGPPRSASLLLTQTQRLRI